MEGKNGGHKDMKRLIPCKIQIQVRRKSENSKI